MPEFPRKRPLKGFTARIPNCIKGKTAIVFGYELWKKMEKYTENHSYRAEKDRYRADKDRYRTENVAICTQLMDFCTEIAESDIPS